MGDELRVYCHRPHQFEDMSTRAVHKLSPRQWYALEEGLARRVVTAHPSKLCLIPDEQDPSKHKCVLTKEVAEEKRRALEEREAQDDYADEMMTEPDVDKMMRTRLSPQRRRLQRQAWGRSRRARVETRG